MKFRQLTYILIFILLTITPYFSQTLTLTVTDQENNFVNNLNKEEVKLRIDKTSQEIVSLKKVETPLCIGVLFDVSGSMKHSKLLKYSIAAQGFKSFLKKSSKKNSYFFITFAKDLTLELDTTTDQNKIAETLETFSKERMNVNGTAVYDALSLAYEKLSACSSRKAIILISDGQDFDSKKGNTAKIGKLAKHDNTMIYSVNLVTERDFNLALPDSIIALKKVELFPLFERGLDKTLHFIFDESLVRTGAQNICDLSAETGGRLFLPMNFKETEQVFAYLADELNNQYVLSFNQTDLKKTVKKIKVEIIGQHGKDKYKIRTRKEF